MFNKSTTDGVTVNSSGILDCELGLAGQAKLDAKGATSCEAMAKSGCPDQALSFTIMVGR